MGKYLPTLPSVRQKPWMWAFFGVLYLLTVTGQFALQSIIPPKNPVLITGVEQHWRLHEGVMGWEISMDVNLLSTCGLNIDRTFLLNGASYQVRAVDAYDASLINRASYLREASKGERRIYHWYPITYKPGLQYLLNVFAVWCEESDFQGPVLPPELRKPIDVKPPAGWNVE